MNRLNKVSKEGGSPLALKCSAILSNIRTMSKNFWTELRKRRKAKAEVLEKELGQVIFSLILDWVILCMRLERKRRKDMKRTHFKWINHQQSKKKIGTTPTLTLLRNKSNHTNYISSPHKLCSLKSLLRKWLIMCSIICNIIEQFNNRKHLSNSRWKWPKCQRASPRSPCLIPNTSNNSNLSRVGYSSSIHNTLPPCNNSCNNRCNHSNSNSNNNNNNPSSPLKSRPPTSQTRITKVQASTSPLPCNSNKWTCHHSLPLNLGQPKTKTPKWTKPLLNNPLSRKIWHHNFSSNNSKTLLILVLIRVELNISVWHRLLKSLIWFLLLRLLKVMKNFQIRKCLLCWSTQMYWLETKEDADSYRRR